MKTDHLDLWQIHDVRTEDDIEQIFGPDGAIEAFEEAKDKGLARFIGVTGHHDPFIVKRCIEMYDFNTVLIPVNPAEPTYKSFLDIVIPLANEKGMGIIGMKVYFRGFVSRIPGFINMVPYFRFALSQPQLEENVNMARSFVSMPEKEMEKFVDHISPYAKQLMYYKP
jgi:predicted aldo/keto reductase-like oxidoreductase